PTRRGRQARLAHSRGDEAGHQGGYQRGSEPYSRLHRHHAGHDRAAEQRRDGRRATGRSNVLGMARLEDYSFGRIVVDGEEQTRDLIVLPGRVHLNWWRREGHSLAIEDLSEVEDALPDKLILGTGAHGQLRPPRPVIEELERRGIDVEVLRT